MGSGASDSSTSEDSSEEPVPPEVFGVGTSLDWDSPLLNVTLTVELPFWLIMPANSLRVTLGDFTTDVVIENQGVEIQRGRQFTRTHQNTVFIGGNDAARNASAPVTALPEGGLFRATRTLLHIETYASEDALNAFWGQDSPRYRDASRYFASLALGHIPLVNKVVNAYRMASVDPFAHEVTAWDVPVWFVGRPPEIQPVYLYSHLVEDWYPTIHKGIESDDEFPYFATSVETVQQYLTKGESPGEIEMLDGWSLSHSGRFGDSIRSFVTAIEVLVESEIRRLLVEKGHTPEQVDTQIEVTRNNFENRLKDYCKLSRRRIPGPNLHYVPYLNGIRLRDELERTRRLRHQIVHHGHRLDHTFSKPMLRAAETTSWLYDWISSPGDFEERRGKNSTFFVGAMTNAVRFECEIREGRIVVIPPFWLEELNEDSAEESIVLTSIHRVVHNDMTLLRTIGRTPHEGKDLEHFVKMSFYELGVGELEDSPYEETSRAISERFRMRVGEKSIPVFALDTSGSLTGQQIEDVNVCMIEMKESGQLVDSAVLVVNDQNGREWFLRNAELDADSGKLAAEFGICVVRTPDLARMVLGAMKYSWSFTTIIGDILQGGVFRAGPPASQYLGDVYHFWDEQQVVGVETIATFKLSDADIVVIELPQRFHQCELAKPRLDSNGRLTFKIDLERCDVPVGSHVYLLDRHRSFQPEAVEEA
ncbi:MAG: hypothetical protein R3C18_26520 [Planctomycetaceae bacterium]